MARFSGQSGREAKSWGGTVPYEQNAQPADVGAKTRSAAAFINLIVNIFIIAAKE